MSRKYNLIFILTLIICIFTVGCSKNNKSNEDILVTLVLDKGGVNDESFNQLAWSGAQRAAQKHGVTVKYLESNTDADYKSNMEQAVDLKSNLIIAVGFNLSEAVKTTAESYPDEKFAIIDGSFDKIPENATTVVFDEAQAGYLAGLAAAKNLDTNNFGFVGGIKVPAVENYLTGFQKGILEVNPKASLYIQYANSFTDAAKGIAIATKMYNDGIECIMTAAGGVNTGVYEIANELNKYAVAVDMAQNHLFPNVILTSAIKKVDVGVENTIKSLIDNKLEGGTSTIYNIKNIGVTYEKTDLLTGDTITFVNDKIKELQGE